MEIKEILEEIVSGEAQLFDVREKNEWDQGHINFAHHVPLSELTNGVFPHDSLSRSAKTYLHCRSGVRVHSAKSLLQAMGFTKIIPLRQGFHELVSEGFPQQ